MRGAHPERAVERAIERSGVFSSGRARARRVQRRTRLRRARGGHACRRERAGLAIRAAFVNHGVRASAWQDECIVLQLAAQLEMPLDLVALQPDAWNEQRLRTARYDALIEVAKRRGVYCRCNRTPRGRSE